MTTTADHHLTILARIDGALREQEQHLARDRARRAAKAREDRIRQAMPVIGTDWDGTPIADPTAPNLCENR